MQVPGPYPRDSDSHVERNLSIWIVFKAVQVLRVGALLDPQLGKCTMLQLPRDCLIFTAAASQYSSHF